jgi:hypothetical protein
MTAAAFAFTLAQADSDPSVADAAYVLGLTYQQVYARILTRRLVGYRDGRTRRWRVSAASLEAALRAMRDA